MTPEPDHQLAFASIPLPVTPVPTTQSLEPVYSTPTPQAPPPSNVPRLLPSYALPSLPAPPLPPHYASSNLSEGFLPAGPTPFNTGGSIHSLPSFDPTFQGLPPPHKTPFEPFDMGNMHSTIPPWMIPPPPHSANNVPEMHLPPSPWESFQHLPFPFGGLNLPPPGSTHPTGQPMTPLSPNFNTFPRSPEMIHQNFHPHLPTSLHPPWAPISIPQMTSMPPMPPFPMTPTSTLPRHAIGGAPNHIPSTPREQRQRSSSVRDRNWTVVMDTTPSGEFVAMGLVSELGEFIHHGPGQHIRPSPMVGPGSQSASGLVDYCNVFVKGLDLDISSETLQELFSPMGRIISARVMRDEYQRSRGYGFVSYHSPAEAQRAINEMNNHKIGRSTLSVTLHEPKKLRSEKVAPIGQSPLSPLPIQSPLGLGHPSPGPGNGPVPGYGFAPLTPITSRGVNGGGNPYRRASTPTSTPIHLGVPWSPTRRVSYPTQPLHFPGATHPPTLPPRHHLRDQQQIATGANTILQGTQSRWKRALPPPSLEPPLSLSIPSSHQPKSFQETGLLPQYQSPEERLKAEINKIDPVDVDLIMEVLKRENMDNSTIRFLLADQSRLERKYSGAKKEVVMMREEQREVEEKLKEDGGGKGQEVGGTLAEGDTGKVIDQGNGDVYMIDQRNGNVYMDMDMDTDMDVDDAQ